MKIIMLNSITLFLILTTTLFANEIESFTIALKKGWNLISIPLIPTDNDYQLINLFPDANVAYEFKNGAYIAITTLKPGIGYWIQVDNDITYTIYGTLLSKCLQGPSGDKGDSGLPPEHEWIGTSLRLTRPDGSWGQLIELKGNNGLNGQNGTIPEHEWKDTSIRFKKPDGSWGNYVDIKGENAISPLQEVENNSFINSNKFGIRTNDPQATLDVNGGVRIGNFLTSERPNCYSSTSGTLIFDSDKKKPYVCDGDKWKPLDSDFDSDGIVDWNDENDLDETVKHPRLKPENIKLGVNIFGVSGNYTEKIGFDVDTLIDVSGLRIAKSHCPYQPKDKNIINKRQIKGNYHFFITMLTWNDIVNCSIVALICKYDKINNSFQYYQTEVFSVPVNQPQKYITYCNDEVYFILSYGIGSHIHYSWKTFNLNSLVFSEQLYSSESISSRPTLPCKGSLGNPKLYVNQREWNQKVEFNYECDPNCGDRYNCKIFYRMFLYSNCE